MRDCENRSKYTRKLANTRNKDDIRTYLRAVNDVCDRGERSLLKSYSFWAHHRGVAERWREVAKHDDALTRKCLRLDSKNLLSYDHRCVAFLMRRRAYFDRLSFVCRRWMLHRASVSLEDELQLTEGEEGSIERYCTSASFCY